MLVAFCASVSHAVEISREACDALYAPLAKEDPWEATKEANTLAWNESYTLHGLVDLYEATHDPKYLAELVRRSDVVLSHRDDRRNFADWTGQIHKRWSISGKYTVAEAKLLDAEGKPVILLRSTLFAYNNQTKAEVTAQGRAFTIHLTNRYWKRDETFSDLSMDPASPRYFAKIINDEKPRDRPFCAPGTCTEASQLVIAKPASGGGVAAAPKAQSLTLTPLNSSHTAYIGIIYHPMLRFAKLVKDDPSLAKEFQEPANRFTAEAEASFEEARSHFRDGPGKDEGHYFGSERGGASPYDNLGYAFNYLGKMATSELLLHQLTGKEIYREHVTKIATLFKRRLEKPDADRYVWDYWYEPVTTGWTKADDISLNIPAHSAWRHIEDTSHGALEVEMAVNCAAAGIVFDASDIQRFANTFTQKVVNADRTGFNGQVDGSAPKSEFFGARVAGWLPLAQQDLRVYEVARKVYENRNKGDFPSAARLLKWQNTLEMPPAR